MDIWRHLFLDSEFASREHILAGLSLEQAGARPAGAPHSIYEELWHTVGWQRIVLDQDEEAEERWRAGEVYPDTPAPASEREWRELVDAFLADLERAAAIGNDETLVDTDELDKTPGFTWRNALEFLAVHNSYHMGKIVLLRQIMGIWTPERRGEAGQAQSS